jgi:metallo-beta-lactamase family protein
VTTVDSAPEARGRSSKRGPGAALSFWGAAGTVTGSKFLLEMLESSHPGAPSSARVLLDCGLFQGPKVWRQRNWGPPGFLRDERGDDARLDAIVLTHAHLDHSGYLPRLVAVEHGTAPSSPNDSGTLSDHGGRRQRGRSGPDWRVYTTPSTVDLLRVMLPDSAHLQEEDAAYANTKGFSRHHPALPLYTMADAYESLRLLRPRDYDAEWEVVPGSGLSALFEDAGHIMGSSTVRFTLPDGRHVLFSGDLGRYVNPLLRNPTPPGDVDVLVMESTYGGRQHSTVPAEDGLAAAANEAVERGGVLLIPAFAVGRTQDLLYALRDLMVSGRIPELPIYVDSPMAIEATRIFLAHVEAQDPDLHVEGAVGRGHREALRWSAEGGVRYAHTRLESQALNELRTPAVIIAASGMATGGRVLHHLKHRLPLKNTVVLLVGYQAEGTRGRLLLEGARTLRIHGQDVPVHAQVQMVDGFSAHADEPELLRWLDGLSKPPKRLFLVHGEPESSEALAASIRARFGWQPEIAQYGERVIL